MKNVITILASLFMAFSAVAQHPHGDQKGPNGGQMLDVAGVDAELLVNGNMVTINIYDEANKPISTKGFSASALIVSGSERETLTLVPSDENAIKGTAKKPVQPGAAITVTLKTAAGKSGQARFKL